ncbi:MAG: hypothetical protein A2Y97_13795 [Nitrospirae bacterium RBG_13_39_12]|nr:MAG: hypothetical protein A2Y97_13795 [Nitrospirae bacterium RBG_13_39_12]
MQTATIFKLNTIGFIATSISCYQGALRGMPWLGLAVFTLLMVIFLPFTDMKKERILLTIIVGVIGFLLDSILILFDIYTVNIDTRWLLPASLCPEWILALWLNFGFMLYIYWLILRRSYVVSGVIGIIFAFIIYGNAHWNGLLKLHRPALVSILIIAVIWAVLIPVLTMFAIKFFSREVHHATQTK